MEPNNDPDLRELLREWEVPPASSSLDERVLRFRYSRWHYLLKGSVRVPVPVALCVTVLLAVGAWRLSQSPDSPPRILVKTERIEVPVVQERVVTRTVYKDRPNVRPGAGLTTLRPVGELRARLIRNRHVTQ